MVVTQVVDLGHLLATKAEELDGIARRIAGTLHHVQWFGEQAETFRGDLTYHLPALTHCAAILRGLSQRAFDNAKQQQDASQGDGRAANGVVVGGAVLPAAFTTLWATLSSEQRLALLDDPGIKGLLEWLGLWTDRHDPADLAGWALGIGNLAAGVGIEVMTKVRYGVFQPRDALGRFLSKSAMESPWSRFQADLLHPNSSWHALPDKAAVRGSWETAGKWVGRVGLVVTFGVAAWDQWQNDSHDPSLDTAAKVGRATTEGATTAAGAWAGAEAGAWIGGAIGTAICPGVGTVIGGFVGGLVGGAAGAGAGDWAGQHLVDPVGKASDAVAHWVGNAGSSLEHDVAELKFW
jgi:hypothetical protein